MRNTTDTPQQATSAPTHVAVDLTTPAVTVTSTANDPASTNVPTPSDSASNGTNTNITAPSVSPAVTVSVTGDTATPATSPTTPLTPTTTTITSTTATDKDTAAEEPAKPAAAVGVVLPPVRPSSTTTSSHPPTAYAGLKNDISDTTERDSSYATALATKVGGSEPALMTFTPPVSATTTTTITSTSSTAQPSAPGSPPVKKQGGKLKAKILGGIVAVLVLIGGATGIYLVQQQQDLRQQAGNCDATTQDECVKDGACYWEGSCKVKITEGQGCCNGPAGLNGGGCAAHESCSIGNGACSSGWSCKDEGGGGDGGGGTTFCSQNSGAAPTGPGGNDRKACSDMGESECWTHAGSGCGWLNGACGCGSGSNQSGGAIITATSCGTSPQICNSGTADGQVSVAECRTDEQTQDCRTGCGSSTKTVPAGGCISVGVTPPQCGTWQVDVSFNGSSICSDHACTNENCVGGPDQELTFSGRVYCTDNSNPNNNTPIANQKIEVAKSSGGEIADVTTDADGRYSVSSSVSKNDFAIRLKKPFLGITFPHTFKNLNNAAVGPSSLCKGTNANQNTFFAGYEFCTFPAGATPNLDFVFDQCTTTPPVTVKPTASFSAVCKDNVPATGLRYDVTISNIVGTAPFNFSDVFLSFPPGTDIPRIKTFLGPTSYGDQHADGWYGYRIYKNNVNHGLQTFTSWVSGNLTFTFDKTNYKIGTAGKTIQQLADQMTAWQADVSIPAAERAQLLNYRFIIAANLSMAGVFNNGVGSSNIEISTTACASVVPPPVVPAPDGVAACVNKEIYAVNGSTVGTLLAARPTVQTGTTLQYKVNLQAATMTAGAVTVTDTLPANLELVDKLDFDYNATSRVLSKTLAAFQGNKVLNARVRVKHNITAGDILNTAQVKTVNASGATVGTVSSCSVTMVTPAYACNSGCNANEQCQNFNADYICSAANANRCRIKDNESSESCQPKTFACNSACGSDADCRSVNTSYSCVTTADGNRCRLSTNQTAANCLAATVATATPAPAVGCNQTCVNNADCSNPSHVCHPTASGSVCRLSADINSTTCTVAQQVAGQPQQPVPPQELPQSGPESWSIWLKSGLVVIGIGALLLLLI